MDDGASSTRLLVILFALLLMASGLFSATETALFSLSRVERRRLRHEPSIRSQLIARALSRPRQLLSTILFGNTFVNVATAAVATLLTHRILASHNIVLAIAVDTALVLLFGEIIPKTIAANSPRRLAQTMITPLHLFTRVSAPFVHVFDVLSRRLLRLLDVPDEAGGALTPSELELLFEEAGRKAAISVHETEMARNIMRFSETTAGEIMTPRIDVVSAPIDGSRESLTALMRDVRHSRIPVFEESVDNIVGFINAKEFLLHPDREPRTMLNEIAIFPETAPVHRVLRHMQKNRVNMAVIVNEYGETSGIVTPEDVIEEVVGEIYDEDESGEELIRSVGPGQWVASARVAVSEVNDACGLTLPDSESVTLNGYLCDEFGEIPAPGASIEREGARFTVIESMRRRILRCRIERLSPEAAAHDG